MIVWYQGLFRKNIYLYKTDWDAFSDLLTVVIIGLYIDLIFWLSDRLYVMYLIIAGGSLIKIILCINIMESLVFI